MTGYDAYHCLKIECIPVLNQEIAGPTAYIYTGDIAPRKYLNNLSYSIIPKILWMLSCSHSHVFLFLPERIVPPSAKLTLEGKPKEGEMLTVKIDYIGGTQGESLLR